jgi:hypothetical protein
MYEYMYLLINIMKYLIYLWKIYKYKYW